MNSLGFADVTIDTISVSGTGQGNMSHKDSNGIPAPPPLTEFISSVKVAHSGAGETDRRIDPVLYKWELEFGSPEPT